MMCSRLVFCGLLPLIFLSLAAAPATQPLSARDQAVRDALAKPVGTMKLSGEAFSDAVERFRADKSLNVFVNWRALNKVQITRDLPITIDLTGLSADKALQRVLDAVGGETVRLGYTIDDGVVTISTRDDLSRNTLTRVYDVRRADDVSKVIRRVRGIEPLSWRDAGGNVGSVRELSGQLIVTQTAEVHQKIIDELADIAPPGGFSYPLLSAKR